MTTISEVDHVPILRFSANSFKTDSFDWAGITSFFWAGCFSLARFAAVGADAGFGVVEFSVVESVYYVFGTVYWDWIGVVASARN